jgi:hypothetical protein
MFAELLCKRQLIFNNNSIGELASLTSILNLLRGLLQERRPVNGCFFVFLHQDIKVVLGFHSNFNVVGCRLAFLL